jgi:uncharacterized phage-like protein YoqJ
MPVQENHMCLNALIAMVDMSKEIKKSSSHKPKKMAQENNMCLNALIAMVDMSKETKRLTITNSK